MARTRRQVAGNAEDTPPAGQEPPQRPVLRIPRLARGTTSPSASTLPLPPLSTSTGTTPDITRPTTPVQPAVTPRIILKFNKPPASPSALSVPTSPTASTAPPAPAIQSEPETASTTRRSTRNRRMPARYLDNADPSATPVYGPGRSKRPAPADQDDDDDATLAKRLKQAIRPPLEGVKCGRGRPPKRKLTPEEIAAAEAAADVERQRDLALARLAVENAVWPPPVIETYGAPQPTPVYPTPPPEPHWVLEKSVLSGPNATRKEYVAMHHKSKDTATQYVSVGHALRDPDDPSVPRDELKVSNGGLYIKLGKRKTRGEVAAEAAADEENGGVKPATQEIHFGVRSQLGALERQGYQITPEMVRDVMFNKYRRKPSPAQELAEVQRTASFPYKPLGGPIRLKMGGFTVTSSGVVAPGDKASDAMDVDSDSSDDTTAEAEYTDPLMMLAAAAQQVERQAANPTNDNLVTLFLAAQEVERNAQVRLQERADAAAAVIARHPRWPITHRPDFNRYRSESYERTKI